MVDLDGEAGHIMEQIDFIEYQKSSNNTSFKSQANLEEFISQKTFILLDEEEKDQVEAGFDTPDKSVEYKKVVNPRLEAENILVRSHAAQDNIF